MYPKICNHAVSRVPIIPSSDVTARKLAVVGIISAVPSVFAGRERQGPGLHAFVVCALRGQRDRHIVRETGAAERGGLPEPGVEGLWAGQQQLSASVVQG